jgi:hypothetical protein
MAVTRLLRRSEARARHPRSRLVLGVTCLLLLPVVVAPPALAGAQGSDDRAAQALLRKAVAATRVWFAQHGTYTGFDAAQGAIIEPSVTWEDGDRTVVNQVNINGVIGPLVMVQTQSVSGTSFCFAAERRNTYRGKDVVHGFTNHAGCAAAPDW